MTNTKYVHPEPVPSASQLAILPFLAAVEGYLRPRSANAEFRVTMHRSMNRAGDQYLQQACAYLGKPDLNAHTKVGRMFPTDEGIIGAAFKTGKIFRTRGYIDSQRLYADLQQDLQDTGDKRRPEDVAGSFLAIPFLDAGKQVVLILYAETRDINFFADDIRINALQKMCLGFCELYDWLQEAPFPNLMNFPLQRGQPVTDHPTVYPRLQEQLVDVEVPSFKRVSSFNYEASSN